MKMHRTIIAFTAIIVVACLAALLVAVVINQSGRERQTLQLNLPQSVRGTSSAQLLLESEQIRIAAKNVLLAMAVPGVDVRTTATITNIIDVEDVDNIPIELIEQLIPEQMRTARSASAEYSSYVPSFQLLENIGPNAGAIFVLSFTSYTDNATTVEEYNAKYKAEVVSQIQQPAFGEAMVDQGAMMWTNTTVYTEQVYVDFATEEFVTPTPTPSGSPSTTPSVTPSRSVTSSMTASSSRSPSSTATDTETQSVSSSASPTSSPTSSLSVGASHSETPTTSMTSTSTGTRTSTASNSQTPSSSVSVTATHSMSSSQSASTSPSTTTSVTSSATTSVTKSGTASPSTSSTASTTPSGTPTKSLTASTTASSSVTATDTSSQTTTASSSYSATESVSVTSTASRSASGTASGTCSGSNTASATESESVSNTATESATKTSTSSASHSVTKSASVTSTASRSVTSSASHTATESATKTSTSSASHSATSSASVTATKSSSVTPTATNSASQTGSASLTPTASSSRTATRSATTSRTASRTASKTASTTASHTATASRTPSSSSTGTKTPSSTTTATNTPTSSLTPTSSSSPSKTPTSSATPSSTVLPSPGEAIMTESLVNTVTEDSQRSPYPCALEDTGGWVVVFEDNPSAAYETDIVFRIFDQGGYALTDQITVHESVSDDQDTPVCTSLPGGGFGVGWVDDSVGKVMTVRLYSSDGTPITDEVQVSNTSCFLPAMSYTADGGVIAVCTGPDSDSFGIRAQKVDSSGQLSGSSVLVNQVETKSQQNPAVITLTNGDFIIAFASSENAHSIIKYRRFDASLSPLTEEITIPTASGYNALEPQLTSLPTGSFAIMWSQVTASSSYDVYAYLLDSNGNDIRSPFAAVAFDDQQQYGFLAAYGDDGGFVVYASSLSYDASSFGIASQWFDSSGNAVGDLVQVNTYENSMQYRPRATTLNNGAVVVAWTSKYQDGSNYGVIQRYFNIP